MDAILNEDWTADAIGRMHKYRITNLQLAEACGFTAAYLSTVLNGRKQFKSASSKEEIKDKILQALAELEDTVIKDQCNDGSTN